MHAAPLPAARDRPPCRRGPLRVGVHDSGEGAGLSRRWSASVCQTTGWRVAPSIQTRSTCVRWFTIPITGRSRSPSGRQRLLLGQPDRRPHHQLTLQLGGTATAAPARHRSVRRRSASQAHPDIFTRAVAEPPRQSVRYDETSCTTVRSTNSGAPSKMSAIVALAACSPSWRRESFSRERARSDASIRSIAR